MSLSRTANPDRQEPRRLSRPVLILVALQALFLAACANTSPSARPSMGLASQPAEFGHLGAGAYQPILAELPKDAPPGDCYAHVIVPGQPVVGPPQAQGAAWVLNPGPPGSPGPIWCLVPTGPVTPVVMMSPDRDGWIRVLCDADATVARIEFWQRRLRQDGYYQGAADGRYDPATAEAVSRFQRDRHIDHGGYLSLNTVEALEGPPGPPPRQGYVAAAPVYSPPPARHAAPAIAHSAAPARSDAYAAAAAAGVSGYAPYPAMAAQSAYGYPAYSAAPTYPQAYPAPPQTYAYPQAGYARQGGGYASQYGASYQSQSSYASSYSSYGVATPAAYGYSYGGQGYAYPGYGYGVGPRPAYAAGQSAIQDGWLTWAGKSRF